MTRNPRARRNTSVLRRRQLRVESLEKRQLLAAGMLDTSFGTGGFVTTDLGGNDLISAPSGIAVQADGKIVAAGQGSASLDFLVARYEADGSPDLSFNGTGEVATNIAGTDRGYAVAIQSDGKILVGGRAGAKPAIVRYNDDGTLDATFGTGGISVLSSVTANQGDKLQDLAIQSDGMIVGAVNGDVSSQLTVVRLTTSGVLDTGFSGDGVADINFQASATEFAYAVKIQGDGKIVVVGRVTNSPVDFQPDVAMARLTTTGALDAGFGSGGKVQTALGANEGANDVDFQSDGKIVIGAQSLVNDAALLRYTTAGVLDSTFGTAGVATPGFGVGSAIFSIEVTATDKIAAAMPFKSTDFEIAQFESDGALDASFGTGGLATHHLVNTDRALSLKLQTDGKIVAGGTSNQNFAVARFIGDAPAPNVAPQITSLSVDHAMIFEDESVTLDGDFTDSDVGDEHTVTINWGDGMIQIETLNIGDRSFSFAHQYLDDGTSPGNGTPQDDYAIDVTVADDNGGIGTLATGSGGLELDFASSFGSSGSPWEFTNDVITDAAGDIYVTGSFSGLVDFDPGVGVANLTGTSPAEPFVAKYSASGDLIWARDFDSSGNIHLNGGTSLALDSLGNLYVGGLFHGTMDSDPGPAVNNLNTFSSLGAGFLIKLDSAGDFIWSHQLTLHSPIHSVAVDASDNLYYAFSAHRNATIDVDPSAGVFNVFAPPGTGPQRGFVVKVNSGGTLDWVRGAGGFGQGAVNTPYLAVDGSGNVYATGSFSSTVDFDPSVVGTANLMSAGGNDTYVWKLDSSGDFVWAKGMGGNGNDDGFDITLDSSDDLYIGGQFQGTSDFDPGPLTTHITSAGSGDGYAAKLDSSGNFVWAQSFGGSAYDAIKGVAVDQSDRLFATGLFQQTVDFDPTAGVSNLTSVGGTDIVVWQLDSNGDFLDAVSAGGTGSDEGNKIAVDTSGGVSVGGWFNGLVDFDPTAGTSNLTSNGGNDGLLWKLAPSTSLDPAVTVKNVDPVAADQLYSMDEDDLLNMNVLSGIDDSGPFTVTDQGTLDVLTAVAGTFPTAQGGSVTIVPNGDATYTPPLDFNGTDSFDFTAEDDDAGSDVGSVMITVDPVNDEPSFTMLGDQTVTEDSGPHSVAAFATALPGGGLDEASQTFTYNVANDNATLFDIGPAIDANGQLTYTLAADANGVTIVTVSVTDSGGTANGGVDTSAQQTFQITVLSGAQQVTQVEQVVASLLDDEILENGEANPLLNFLDQALKDLAKGKTSQAIKKLNDFIDRVQDLIDDGDLTPLEGQPLIDAANAAIQSAL